MYGAVLSDGVVSQQIGVSEGLRGRGVGAQGAYRFLLGASTAAMRSMIKVYFQGQIDTTYRAPSPVTFEGVRIVRHATRSESAK